MKKKEKSGNSGTFQFSKINMDNLEVPNNIINPKTK